MPLGRVASFDFRFLYRSCGGGRVAMQVYNMRSSCLLLLTFYTTSTLYLLSAYFPLPASLKSIYCPHPFTRMTIEINDTNSYNSHHTSHPLKMQPKSKPDTLLLSHAMPTSQQPPARPKHADIFSPRPETPAPAQFPFLNSPTPPRHSRATPQPATPLRPRPRRTRQTLSADDALPRRNGLDLGVRPRTSFELTLAAFPAPPIRTPFFRSLPASPMASSIRLWKERKSPLGLNRKNDEKEDVEMDSGSDDDSDCRTITGIPATPSTVNSGWDNFWSEVGLLLFR